MVQQTGSCRRDLDGRAVVVLVDTRGGPKRARTCRLLADFCFSSRPRLSNAGKALPTPYVASTELPLIPTVRARDEGSHRLVGAPGLLLIVSAFALLAATALESVRLCFLFSGRLSGEHVLLLECAVLCETFFRCHFLWSEVYECVGGNDASGDALAERRVLGVFEIQRQGANLVAIFCRDCTGRTHACKDGRLDFSRDGKELRVVDFLNTCSLERVKDDFETCIARLVVENRKVGLLASGWGKG